MPAGADGHEPFAGDPAYFRRALAQPKDRWWERFNRMPLDVLERAGTRPGMRLLDVGCNVGYFVALASTRGYRARGIDSSPAAVTAGRAALGVDLVCAQIATAPIEPESVDIVVLNHVLEHVPDPVQTIAAVRRWLVPAGWLLVSLPNFASPVARWAGPRWNGLVADQHVWHFTPRALRGVLARATMVCVASRTTMLVYVPARPVDWVKWSVRRALEPLGLADNLLVVARRPLDVRADDVVAHAAIGTVGSRGNAP